MTKNLLILLTLFCGLTSCGQTTSKKEGNGFTIDPSIKNEVEKHIENSKEFDAFKDKMQVYANSVLTESYENDSLILSNDDIKNKTLFKSFYLWRNDTLNIDGAYGLFGGTGFCIKYKDNTAKLYHMLSSDDFPTYAYKENDSLIDRLEVPCTDTKIVLSEIPDSTKKQIIYGYVEFKSKDYFVSSGSADGQEILPRKKYRSNMRIYFKSGHLDF
jgi:hypothetical protein